MNSLQPELDRLYGPDRAMVLEVVVPAGWEQLSQVWKAVQSELDLPAPAIAISGVDGLQLWFSLASPVSSSNRARFLQGLRHRYLAGLAPEQVRLFADSGEIPTAPPVEVDAQHWAAFVTSDLVSMFAETPWLDIPPGEEGQATLLRAMASMQPAAFEAALSRLTAIEGDGQAEGVGEAGAEGGAAITATPTAGAGSSEPARFLAKVMNDETAPLALRIEAAKALLPFARRT